MSNAHPSTGLQNSYKYHINYIYSTINNKNSLMSLITTHFVRLYQLAMLQFEIKQIATVNKSCHTTA